jgi:nitric oxide reductase NorD protein
VDGLSSPGVPRAPTHLVRALWGIDVEVVPAPDTAQGRAQRARFDGNRVWLPLRPLLAATAHVEQFWLAAAAHIGAHLTFGGPRFAVNKFKPAQIAIISLLEDARVEHLARERYPGLVYLWGGFHLSQAERPKTSSVLLARLARALHDERHVDEDAWVSKGQALFFERRADWHDANLCREIGSRLANDLGQMRVQFNAKDMLVEPAYRDDHTGLWESENAAADSELSLEESGGLGGVEHQLEQPRDAPAQLDAGSEREVTAKPRPLQVAATTDVEERVRHYPEWDHVIRRERRDFCTLRETRPEVGDAATVDAVLQRFTEMRGHLGRVARGVTWRRPELARRLPEGDHLDLPAVVAALAGRRHSPRRDTRVYRRMQFTRETQAVLVLLDLSESLNDPVPGSESRALDLARNLSALLVSAFDAATIPIAVHGFSSCGRHDVTYCRLHEFHAPFDSSAKAVLAGLNAKRSTRLGTALRHAGSVLKDVRAARKLLIVLTDGEPSDIDVYDDRYLLLDARHAAIDNHRRGITTWCLGFDKSAAPSLGSLFGKRHFAIVDRVDVLPERLARLHRVTS